MDPKETGNEIDKETNKSAQPNKKIVVRKKVVRVVRQANTAQETRKMYLVLLRICIWIIAYLKIRKQKKKSRSLLYSRLYHKHKEDDIEKYIICDTKFMRRNKVRLIIYDI